jgi:FAD/FMN-containing dehydrogenase
MLYFFAPVFPADSAEKVKQMLRAWGDFMLTAPDEVSAEVVLWTVPAAPGFPEAAHGRRVLVLPAVYAGPVEEGKRILAPLYDLGTALADLSAVMPCTTLQTAFDPLFLKGGLRYYWKSLYLDSLGDDVLDALIPRALERPSPKSLVALWQLGGAMNRVPAAAIAFGDRSAPFLLSFDSTWENPQDDDVNIAWTRAFWSDMKGFSSGGLYLNFPGLGEEAGELVRAAYGENYDRLVEIKTQYDPDNLFRMNQNIKPASREAG